MAPGDTVLVPAEADPFFRAERLRPDPAAALEAAFSILVVTAGSGRLDTAGGALDLARGDTVLVPFAAGPGRSGAAWRRSAPSPRAPWPPLHSGQEKLRRSGEAPESGKGGQARWSGSGLPRRAGQVVAAPLGVYWVYAATRPERSVASFCKTYQAAKTRYLKQTDVDGRSGAGGILSGLNAVLTIPEMFDRNCEQPATAAMAPASTAAATTATPTTVAATDTTATSEPAHQP